MVFIGYIRWEHNEGLETEVHKAWEVMFRADNMVRAGKRPIIHEKIMGLG